MFMINYVIYIIKFAISKTKMTTPGPSTVNYFLRVGGLSVDAADEKGWRAIHHASLHG